MRKMRKLQLACGCALALLPAGALAQTVGEKADDAFGRRLGVESIGLYSERQVRGFSLENAGNYRLEDHYFARAASPHYALLGATVTRIGVNALRYDFPAPSGILEFQLRSAPPGETLSVEGGIRPLAGPFIDVTGSIGRKDGTLGLVAALNVAPDQRYANGLSADQIGGGAVGRWSPTPKVHLTAFATAFDRDINGTDTGVLPRGEFLPPKIKRGVYRGQSWTKFDNREQTAGLLGSAELGDGWKLSGGAIHSASQSDRNDFHLLNLLSEQGDYNSNVIVAPRRSASAQSGSLLLERSWSSGLLRHRLIATARYRETDTVTSPSLLFSGGAGNLLGDYPLVPEPDFTITDTRILDEVRQATGALGYRLTIGDDVELRAEVLRTNHSRTRTDVAGISTMRRSDPWLYNASASWGVSDRLTLFGSYSRGLEESGAAPNSAVNRGEVLPAVIATQREVGARYAFTPTISLIAGLFDTRKDTPALGPDGRFGLIGEVRHRGVEASLAGALTPRLNVVAGLMLLDATISGELVDAGLIGNKAVGRPSRIGLLNFIWRPEWVDGLSLDGSLNHSGGSYISSRNQLRTPDLTTVDLGLRYGFKVGTQPLSLRARVTNLVDGFAWRSDVTGTLYPSLQRGFHLSLRADF